MANKSSAQMVRWQKTPRHPNSDAVAAVAFSQSPDSNKKQKARVYHPQLMASIGAFRRKGELVQKGEEGDSTEMRHKVTVKFVSDRRDPRVGRQCAAASPGRVTLSPQREGVRQRAVGPSSAGAGRGVRSKKEPNADQTSWDRNAVV